MRLNAVVAEKTYPIEIADNLIADSEDFFGKMDADMDKGWQMGREWIEQPDVTCRCQIVADKLLTALEQGNKSMIMLMAGYILQKMPGVTEVNIDTQGEMQETRFA